MGSSALSLTLLLMSFIHSGLTQALPRSTLTVTPDSPVFTGERVSLKCEIEPNYSDWRYEWWKGDTYIQVSQTPERHTVKGNTLTIERSETSDEGLYTCRGQRDGGSVLTQSNSVSLSVKVLPTSTLTVTPDNPVFTGERVILKCEIESDRDWRQRNGLEYDRRYDWTYYQTAEWRYVWYKGRKDNNGILKDSQHYTVSRDTLTIRGATESDQDQFWCRGERDERPKSSQSSSASLSVKERPKAVVKVTPDQRVFRGETVTLTCDIQGAGDIQWTYSWFKDASVIRDITERVYTITSVSDRAEYSCRGERSDSQRSDSQRSHISDAVTLTVSARPKAVVKVTPDQRVFRGETVTLRCDIQRAGDIQWTYSWFKDEDTFYPYTTTTTAEFRFTASVSDSAEYSCRGERSDSQRSHISAAVTLTVSDLPTSTLTVTPNSPVFTGETVSLKCVIESDSDWRQRNGLEYDRRYDWTYYHTAEWRYEWYKGSAMLQTSERYTVNRDTLTIRGATESDQDQIWCRGHRDKRPESSQSSSAVSLAVKDLPRSTLSVTPDSPVFTGERVNLTCVIESDSDWRQRNGLKYDRRYDWTYYQTAEWRYEWYKGRKDNNVILKDSQHYTVYRDTLTIRGATESDQDQFWCRGQRDKRPESSQSSSVSLTVKDSPRSTLTVTPDSPVFTGEKVSLKCVIESDSDWRWRNGLTNDRRYYWTYYQTHYQTHYQTYVWRYEWYKGSVKLHSSEHYTVYRDTLTIRGATESDQDQIWCRGQRDQRPNSSQSSSVSLTMKDLPRSTLTVTPDSPVFTGETVNLTCVINSDHSDWKYEWYKGTNNSVKLQTSERYTVNTDTLTIRGATESDQDQFWCRGQRDGRPNSSQESERINLSVNASRSAQISVFNILSFLLAACPYLLATVVLLFKCCRARVISTEDQSQYVVTEE